MSKTMQASLIDTTRCIGCRACQVACKQWNELPAEETSFLPSQKKIAPQFAERSYQNPRDLTDKTWTVITYNEVEKDGEFHWAFGKQQCMHCGTDAKDRSKWPACVTACPVHALEKLEEGPVIWHDDRCIGCRYCMLACPFQIPKFEWDKAWPQIRKCNMCVDRVIDRAGGQAEPSCSKVCPTSAIITGPRDEMLAVAKDRIRKNPDNYIDHIYGEKELGGTCVLVLSSVPFEKIGYPGNLPFKAMSSDTDWAIKGIPYALVCMLAGMLTVYTARRKQIESETTVPGKESEGSGNE